MSTGKTIKKQFHINTYKPSAAEYERKGYDEYERQGDIKEFNKEAGGEASVHIPRKKRSVRYKQP